VIGHYVAAYIVMGAPKRAREVRDASDFNPSRLQQQLSQPKGGRISLTSWTLTQIFEARDAQLLGQFYLPARMSESMRTDDALSVALDNRLSPQRSIPVELVPASAKAKSISVAGEADALFGNKGVGATAETMASIHECLVQHEIAFGVNTATPRDDGSRIDFEHHCYPIEYVRWDPVARIYKARVDPESVPASEISKADIHSGVYGMIGGFEVPIIHGDGRWTIYQRFEIDPFKRATLLAGALVWARHAYAIRDWAKGSVAHGSAKVIGALPLGMALEDANGPTQEAQALADLLRAVASADSPVGIKPGGSTIDFLTNNSTAWQVWTELVGNAERSAARLYLGTDGTLGTNSNAPGIDTTQLFGVAATKVRADLECIRRCFDSGVVVPWTALNFGDSSLAPSRRYMLPDEEQEKRRAAIGVRRTSFYADVKAARENGFDVTQDFVDELAEQYEIEPPQLLEVEEIGPSASLTTKDVAGIVITVNEARASVGVGPLMLPGGTEPDPRGWLTIGEFNSATIAKSDVTTQPAASTPAAPPVSLSTQPQAAPTAPRFKVGARVEALVNHMPGMKGMTGAIAEAHAGAPPYYAVTFDGEKTPHKWLAENEIEGVSSASDPPAAPAAAA
jgi:hypothetical protein